MSNKLDSNTAPRIDPLRRDMIVGATVGFLLIVAAMAVFFVGLRQITDAHDAQEVLDRANRQVQATLRDVGELILAEGASAQIKSLQTNMTAGDAALQELSYRLPGEASQKVFADEIAPAWKTLRATLTSLTSQRGINANDVEVMTTYGKLLSTVKSFETNFALIDKAIVESVARRTQRAYWMIGGMMAAVLTLFILLNVLILRRLRRGLGGDLSYAIATTQRIARGELAQRVTLHNNDSDSLLQALSAMSDSLASIVRDIRSGADHIRSAASEVAAGNANLSARTEAQASTLEETASSMEELTAAVRQNTGGAEKADKLAREANRIAVQGGAVVGTVVATMNGIQESSKKIGEIISVIDGIAFQTNILALNAAVEAARAGEQGRGFAVVATEVRALAKRSADAAKEINTLISASVERVETGTRQVEAAGKTMARIVAAVEDVCAIIEQISRSSREQADGIEQINRAVSQMDNGVQQNAALVEQASAAADSMQSSALQLYQSVSVFKLEVADTAQQRQSKNNTPRRDNPGTTSAPEKELPKHPRLPGASRTNALPPAGVRR